MISALRRLRGDEPSPNACRYAGLPGHTESYFIRANDPQRARALWIKATILAPLQGEAVAETWFIWFDAEKKRTLAQKTTGPWSASSFETRTSDWMQIRANGSELRLAPSGSAKGSVEGRSGVARFDLEWTRPSSPVADPLAMYPLRVLREGAFPKYKVTSPLPWIEVSGKLELPGEGVEVSKWTGMQGHNWGREQAFEYAWGQCLFAASATEPPAMVEAFTGRIRIAGATTPRISSMVVRRGAQSFRFDRLYDLWRQDARIDGDHWILHMEGADGQARLSMDASDRPMVCLGYQNPDGSPRYCFNSKLADVFLQVQPLRGGAFECHSAHGGALEFLRSEPDPRFPDVV